jgi:hypothetical protein
MYSAVRNCRGSTLVSFRHRIVESELENWATLISSVPRREAGHVFFCVSPYFLNKVKAALISPAGEKWATLIKIGPGHTH